MQCYIWENLLGQATTETTREIKDTEEVLDNGSVIVTSLKASLIPILSYTQDWTGLVQFINERLEETRKNHGEKDPKFLIPLSISANCNYRQGKFADAEIIASRVVMKKVKIIDKDYPSILISIKDLAAIQKAVGNHGEAKNLVINALVRL